MQSSVQTYWLVCFLTYNSRGTVHLNLFLRNYFYPGDDVCYYYELNTPYTFLIILFTNYVETSKCAKYCYICYAVSMLNKYYMKYCSASAPHPPNIWK
jgi:hypothetical protein